MGNLRLLTGVRPSGQAHLGNYFAAFEPAVSMQERYDLYLFLADFHSINTVQDPRELHDYSVKLASLLLACGIDTSRSCLYCQSMVPEVCELSWILGCITSYGNITTQSIGVIQRCLLTLENQGGDKFFGQPELDINDFLGVDANGKGIVNILHAVELFQSPDLYASFLLWLLTSLFNKMPEVGDLDKPKIVFFFDEAHLLFNGMPSYRLKQITQVVKLIRSRGIGLYFISQSPTDIPDEVIAQLGNRVQHTLRAYTPSEQKTVKVAADAFRTNPEFNTMEAILGLGTGEALVSFQNENGEPEIVEKATILPPQSKMGVIDDITRNKIINSSPLVGKYEETVERDSAYEELDKMIKEKLEAEAEAKRIEEEAKQAEKEAKEAEKAAKQAEKDKKEAEREAEKKRREAEKAKKNSIEYKLGKKVANTAANKLINKGLNALMKQFFK